MRVLAPLLVLSLSSALGRANAAAAKGPAGVTVETAHSKPVIEIDGDNPMRLPVSEESYSDPGAGCFDALKKEDIGETLDVSGDIVRLDRPGKYTIRYGCVTKDGYKAVPIVRTVIVSDSVTPQYWHVRAAADVELSHATASSLVVQRKAQSALAQQLDVPLADVSITSVKYADKGGFATGHFAARSIMTVAFDLKTTQAALAEDITYELQQQSEFGPSFDAALRQQGLQATGSALGPAGVNISPPADGVLASLTRPVAFAIAGSVAALALIAAAFARLYLKTKAEIQEYQLVDGAPISDIKEAEGFMDAEAGNDAVGGGGAGGGGGGSYGATVEEEAQKGGVAQSNGDGGDLGGYDDEEPV